MSILAAAPIHSARRGPNLRHPSGRNETQGHFREWMISAHGVVHTWILYGVSIIGNRGMQVASRHH